jgi:hypothetical protein
LRFGGTGTFFTCRKRFGFRFQPEAAANFRDLGVGTRCDNGR